MVTLSFSKAIIAGLEQERTKACELNNLRLYKISRGTQNPLDSPRILCYAALQRLANTLF
jgi:hypothetical protein